MFLPLTSMMVGNEFTEEAKQVLESFDWSEFNYHVNPSTPKGPMNKKQVKSRAKSKAARKARKKNRK